MTLRARATMNRLCRLLILMACALWSTVAQASVLYVDDDAPPGGDGASWSTAMRFLQDAFSAASVPGSGVTEIRVAQGVYKPDRTDGVPAGSGDRNARFALQDNLAILGGFRGVFTGKGPGAGAPDDRDIEKFETILHGDLAGDDGAEGTFINSAENTYQIVVAVDVDETAVIDGFTVMSGRGDGVANGADPSSRDQGTAVNIYFASPTILNCTFRNNWMKNHGTINDHGAPGGATIIGCTFRNNYSDRFGSGLYIHHETMTMVMDSRFLDNVTIGEGGGVYSNSAHHSALGSQLPALGSGPMADPKADSRQPTADSAPMHATLMNCEIRGNIAQRGGGIWTASNSNLEVIGCVIADNEAEFGGGMYNDQTVPMVMDCLFTGNVAEIGGGGIFNNFSNAMIHNCTFTNNDAGLEVQGGGGGGGGSGGGGIWNSGAQPMIMDCTFDANQASFGAGVYNIDGSLAVIDTCHFTNNLASEGAGLYSIGDSDAVAVNCMFQNNNVSGGGFPVGGGASSYFSSVTFDRCCFANNSAFLGGGGMYIEGGANNFVIDCLFLDNHTTGSFSGWGGGILNSFGANVTVVNSLFAGNTAQRGGAFHNTVFTSASIINCTMTGNTATGQSGEFGGGIYANTDTATSVANCILWNNAPDQIDVLSPDPIMDVRYSDVQGGFAGGGGGGGVGNINAAPLFVDIDGADNDPATYVDNDYRIAANSPCVDAGDTTALPPSVTRDLDYAMRVVDIPGVPNTGVPLVLEGPVVDMGAYEVQPAPFCPADIAPPGWPNGAIDIDDLLLIVNNWNTANADADIDDSGVVDIDDLLAVVNAWGPC